MKKKEGAGSKSTKAGAKEYLQNAQSNQVQESLIGYWLGMPAFKNIKTGFDLLAISDEGISKQAIENLTSHLGISKKFMAEDILGISVKTLERKTEKDKLDSRASSHAIEIARVMQHGFHVFGSEEKLRRWINTENRALNFQKPIALFKTLTGLGLVNDILGRIEEGVYS